MNQISMFDTEVKESSLSEQFYHFVAKILEDSGRTDIKIKLKNLKSYDAIDFVGLGDATPEIHVKFGKKSSYFSVKLRYRRFLEEHGITYKIDSTKLWLNISIEMPSDALKFSEIFQLIYDDYFTRTSPDSFDCCSLYMQCSDAKQCIHTLPEVKNFCKYRAKLANGIIFHGKNRNV